MTPGELGAGQLRVAAMDENKLLASALIRTGSASLGALLRAGAAEVTVALADGKGRPAGTVVLGVELVDAPAPTR